VKDDLCPHRSGAQSAPLARAALFGRAGAGSTGSLDQGREEAWSISQEAVPAPFDTSSAQPRRCSNGKGYPSSILGLTFRFIGKAAQLGRLALKLIEPHVQHVTNADHPNEAIAVLHWDVANIP
jgi:hypothetical protein